MTYKHMYMGRGFDAVVEAAYLERRSRVNPFISSYCGGSLDPV